MPSHLHTAPPVEQPLRGGRSGGDAGPVQTPIPPTGSAATLPPVAPRGGRQRDAGGSGSAGRGGDPVLGQRLNLARGIRDLTHLELSRRLRVDKSLISKLETGVEPFPEWLLTLAAAELQFPVPFFTVLPGAPGTGGESPLPEGEFLRHQAWAGVQVRQLRLAHRWTQLVGEAADRLGSVLPPVPVRLPRLVTAEPEAAAHAVRAALYLPGLDPVAHLLAAVEQSGVTVFGLPVPARPQAAFSSWRGDRPVLAVLSGAPPDRVRFAVAHELGHLVLHESTTDLPTAEAEANRFAVELLLPLQAVARGLPTQLTVDGLLDGHRTWQLPLPVLLRRARDAGVINEARHGRLTSQLTQLPPVATAAASPEKPERLRRAVECVYGDPVDVARFATDVCWSPHLAAQVLDQHTSPHAPRVGPDLTGPRSRTRRPTPVISQPFRPLSR